ncbi:MAG TPA: TRCF domain-containing protein, partial [Negativicutes bacterium]
VQELKTGTVVELVPEPVLEFHMEAYISGDYISDAMHKIEVYQRIAAVRREEHITELLDELLDRFGEPPLCVLNLLEVARVKNLARQLGIRSVIEQPNRIEIAFSERPNVEPAQVMGLKDIFPARVTVLPGGIYLKTIKIPPDSILSWLVKVLKNLVKTG